MEPVQASGMQCFAARGEDVLIDEAVGTLAQCDEPVTADTRFLLFSASKPLTASLVHLLVQRGPLAYGDLVSAHLPGAPAGVTIEHLLLHQGGLMHAEALLTPESFADWPGVIDTVCTASPSSPPGTVTEYHPLGAFALLAAVVEHVAGSPFRDVFEREIAQPLGMSSTTWGRPDPADAVSTDTVGNDELMAAAVAPWNHGPGSTALVPAGGAWSTARDMGRFYAMLRGGGLLSPATVAEAVKLRVPFSPSRTMGFGYGFFVGVDPAAPASRGTLASPSTYGHPGFCSALAQRDPERDLVMVFLVNGAPQQAESDARFSELADAVIRSADADGLSAC
jgi:CubicO group peptidase (beta-lactamase class C family)